uniref:Uncharacterized protein n=1 Tax=Brassica oleracea var. oleracea TaxID=109376 RepID=A0A0D3EEH1_BRAOL
KSPVYGDLISKKPGISSASRSIVPAKPVSLLPNGKVIRRTCPSEGSNFMEKVMHLDVQALSLLMMQSVEFLFMMTRDFELLSMSGALEEVDRSLMTSFPKYLQRHSLRPCYHASMHIIMNDNLSELKEPVMARSVQCIMGNGKNHIAFKRIHRPN